MLLMNYLIDRKPSGAQLPLNNIHFEISSFVKYQVNNQKLVIGFDLYKFLNFALGRRNTWEEQSLLLESMGGKTNRDTIVLELSEEGIKTLRNNTAQFLDDFFSANNRYGHIEKDNLRHSDFNSFLELLSKLDIDKLKKDAFKHFREKEIYFFIGKTHVRYTRNQGDKSLNQLNDLFKLKELTAADINDVGFIINFDWIHY